MDEYDKIFEMQLAARYEDGVRDERERSQKIIDEKDVALEAKDESFRKAIVGVLKKRFPESRWDLAGILSMKSWDELNSLMEVLCSCDSAEEFRRVAEQS